MRIDVITLFPDFIRTAADVGVVGRAKARGLIEIATWNPRDFALDNYRSADERPYGGGPGMVMMVDPLRRALDAVRAAGGPEKAIYLSPQGARLTQRKVEELARRDRLFLLCGRYEGIDERFLEHAVDEEISIGDYVISGGELAAAIVIDAVGRLQEGALNDAQSAEQDSFSDGLLDCPHYTRPEHLAGKAGEGSEGVPEELLSGHHEDIRKWRLMQSLGRTKERRPGLLENRVLTKEEERLLAAYRSRSRQQ